jgi:hypothetical protein
MKFHMCPELRFWVEWEVSREAPRHPDLSKQKLIAKILHEFEEVGDATRYLRPDGKIGWKPTPQMLERPNVMPGMRRRMPDQRTIPGEKRKFQRWKDHFGRVPANNAPRQM